MTEVSNKSVTRESNLIESRGRVGLIRTDEIFKKGSKPSPEVRGLKKRCSPDNVEEVSGHEFYSCKKLILSTTELGRGLQTLDETTDLAGSWTAALCNAKQRTQLKKYLDS